MRRTIRGTICPGPLRWCVTKHMVAPHSKPSRMQKGSGFCRSAGHTTEAKLDKLREKHATEEAQILFDQELAEALQRAELELTATWEEATGLSAGASSLKASFCAVGF